MGRPRFKSGGDSPKVCVYGKMSPFGEVPGARKPKRLLSEHDKHFLNVKTQSKRGHGGRKEGDERIRCANTREEGGECAVSHGIHGQLRSS